MNPHVAPSSLKSMSGLSGVITACHLKSSSYLCLQAPPTSPLSFTAHDASRFWFTVSLHVKNITHFSWTCMAFEKHPSPFLTRAAGYGFSSVLWMKGRGTRESLASRLHPQDSLWWMRFHIELLRDAVHTTEKAPNMASVALTNSSRRLLCLCGLSRWPC